MPYSVLEVPATPLLAYKPIRFPVDVLLALPELNRELPRTDRYTPKTGLFNLPAAINEILGMPGWSQAMRIMRPHIWAPGWNRNELNQFLTMPFGTKDRWLSESALAELDTDFRTKSPFQRLFVQRAAVRKTRYAICHYTGADRDLSSYLPFSDMLQNSRLARTIQNLGSSAQVFLSSIARLLASRLAATETRLLIFEVSRRNEGVVEEWAKRIVRQRGPAVLVVSGSERRSIDAYFTHMYAGIIHNQPLRIAAQPRESDRVSVFLSLAREADSLLSFDPLKNQLLTRVRRLSAAQASLYRQLSIEPEDNDLVKSWQQYLHRTDVPKLTWHVAKAANQVVAIGSGITSLQRDLDFSHETGGVYPLVDIEDKLPELEIEASSLYPALQSQLTEDAIKAAQRAPRVLNANFADPSTRHVHTEREGLVAGRQYDFLVDVGPRWSEIASLVSGHADFPEKALPPSDAGFLVKVVATSDQFTPGLAWAWIWVPTKTGRSFAFYPKKNRSDATSLARGHRAKKPGPVAIKFTAPGFPDQSTEIVLRAEARLCLFYEGNLLQSAVIRVGVVRAGREAVLNEPNEVVVDFSLSNSLQDVEINYGRRNLQSDSKGNTRGYPVQVNFTLNENGRGDHRIIVTGRPETELPPAGWAQYKPVAAGPILKVARDALVHCFFLRDENGVLQNESALDDHNVKSYDQFRFDLRELAMVGKDLYNLVVGQIRSEDGQAAVDWTRRLAKALDETSVIQVARTGPAEYVLPWALVYDLPMPGPNFEFCKIVKEEWLQPIQMGPDDRRACLHRNEPWHQENIFCPYSFWGLKHIVEQPPSQIAERNGRWEPVDAVKCFATSQDINFAVAVTRDSNLNLRLVDLHLDDLNALKNVIVRPPSPADDVEKARKAFEAPNIVYFLCHGEMDMAGGVSQPYLGIGPRDGNVDHKIFPQMIQDWARSTKIPNLADWSNRRPLVFVNGCGTFAVTPDQMLTFIAGFSFARASGIIGTEVSVQLRVASEVAKSLLEKLCSGVEAGTAMRRMRWELASKRNLLGLAYTLYGMADLRAGSGTSTH